MNIPTLRSVIAWSPKNVARVLDKLLNCDIGKLDEFILLGIKSRRIFQVNNNLLIVTSRVKLPIKELINKCVKVTRIIFEVYGDKQVVTEDEVMSEINLITNRVINYEVRK